MRIKALSSVVAAIPIVLTACTAPRETTGLVNEQKAQEIVATRVQPKIRYTSPSERPASAADFVVWGDQRSVYDTLVLGLNGPRLTISHIDPDAKFLVVVYAGDPEGLIDCGSLALRSDVLYGDGIVQLAAASAKTQYEVRSNVGPAIVTRDLRLDARSIVRLASASEEQTLIGVESTYVLTRQSTFSRPTGEPLSTNVRTIAFRSGEVGNFGSSTRCVPTGLLERSITEALSPVRVAGG